MRRTKIYNFQKFAGFFTENNSSYTFKYENDYSGPPISLTIPIKNDEYYFEEFPPFFDGLLPEGTQLEALLRQTKIDRSDLFSQLLIVGKDLIGSVTVEEA